MIHIFGKIEINKRVNVKRLIIHGFYSEKTNINIHGKNLNSNDLMK